jgi:hypothetical protein
MENARDASVARLVRVAAGTGKMLRFFSVSLGGLLLSFWAKVWDQGTLPVASLMVMTVALPGLVWSLGRQLERAAKEVSE